MLLLDDIATISEFEKVGNSFLAKVTTFSRRLTQLIEEQ
jgi:hypothetical protein